MIAPLLFAMMLATPDTYLRPVTDEMRKTWPDNRAVNIVCHGHSVPAGYFRTPEVRTLDAYPHLLLEGLKKRFPYAVVNVIVTAIGGENSVAGAKRFATDVLIHRPDVVLIDYGLNDRPLPLAESRKAWKSMVDEAKAWGAKVILLTPTGDLSAKMDDPLDPLARQAEQIREIAKEENVGLADSFEAFQSYVAKGGDLTAIMAQSNHPNRLGHELVAERLLRWFPETSK